MQGLRFSVQHRTVSATSRNATRVSTQRSLCRSLCPYETLGIPATADDAQVKKAFRKLALQYHPDVYHSDDAHSTFLAIQQAYDILSGKARGKDIPTTQADWEWHDWYWNFCRSRGWKQNAAGKAQSQEPVKPDLSSSKCKDNLRTQLAGLRHRAAIRAQKTRHGNVQNVEVTPAAPRGNEDHPKESINDDQSTGCSDGAHESSAEGQGNTRHESIQPRIWTTQHTVFDENGPQPASGRRSHRSVPGLDHNAALLQQLAGLKRKAAFSKGV